MIRVYLTNMWDIEKESPDIDTSYAFSWYGYNKELYPSYTEITESVTNLEIEHIDFYVRKEPSKAKIDCVSNEGMIPLSISSTPKENLTAMRKNNEMIFNKDVLRLGTIVTIVDDEYSSDGNELNTVEQSEGMTQTATRNADGTFTLSQPEYEQYTMIMSNSEILRYAKKIFCGRITDLTNDNEKVSFTVENVIYEFRNVYREFYKNLIIYLSYDSKKDVNNDGVRATAGQIINVCKSLINGLSPTVSKGRLDTGLIYDDKYKFLIPPSAIFNKSLIEIMNWALQEYWKQFVVKNKLTIERSGNENFTDVFNITSNSDDSNILKLSQSYPVVYFDYNIGGSPALDGPLSLNSIIITTFYELNSVSESTNDTTSKKVKYDEYYVTYLHPDNIINYRFTRSLKNLVNDLYMLGTQKDDKNNVSIVSKFQFPAQSTESADLLGNKQITDMLWNSRIKYGIHRITRTVDLIDNTVSLETFARDIGSILCEPDYGLTVNIINYMNIRLNDAIVMNLDGMSNIMYEVKNLTYRINNGRSEATLDLKPTIVTFSKSGKELKELINSVPMGLNGKK